MRWTETDKLGCLTNTLGIVLDIATGQLSKGRVVRLGSGGQELALNGLCFGGKSGGHVAGSEVVVVVVMIRLLVRW